MAKKAIQAGVLQMREQEGRSPWDDDGGEPAEIQQVRPWLNNRYTIRSVDNREKRNERCERGKSGAVGGLMGLYSYS